MILQHLSSTCVCDMRLVMSLQLGNMCLHVSATFLQKSFGRLFWSCTHPGHALVEYSLTALLQKTPTHNILLEDIVRQHSLAEYSLRALQQDTLLQPPFVVYAEHYCNSEH